MALFEQTFLNPGNYGPAGPWDADKIGRHVDGTMQMIAAGYRPYLFFEHPKAGSDEGAPVQFANGKPLESERNRRADLVRNGAGWINEVKKNPDGSGSYVLEVSDEIADKLRKGEIKFTSPEFRKRVKVGERVIENVISHAALTHRPRAIGQGPITEVEAMQFSLADYEGPLDGTAGQAGEPTQFADDNGGKPKPGAGDNDASGKPEGNPPADAKPENPDMPQGSNPDKLKLKREAVIAHMDTLGLGLPADTMDCDEEQFLDRVLTGLLTLKSAEAKAAAEQAEKDKADDPDDGEPIREQQPPMQFSLADAESGAIENKLLSRVIRQEHQSLTGRLETMVRTGKITPACRDQLLASEGATQFSGDGEHLAAYTLPQLVEILEKSTIPGMGLTEDVLQFAVEQQHPKGDAFLKGGSGDPTPEEAEKIVDQIFGKKAG